ncbi:MAG TPA: histidinol-phosphatase [Longimicrobiales bacterium]|nr:histidinol-phosphatase [Longimicrobiales bacterium]
MAGERLRDLLDFAVEVAWRAGQVTLAHYQTGVVAETKSDRTPVTVADRASERTARDLIEARFPDDGILGEEFGETRPYARRRWVLDPIDGTKSFVAGVPFYGVLVGLEIDGEAVVGVTHFPALGETVYAARGEGCWWNGRRARVSTVDRIEDAILVTTDAESMIAQGREAQWDRLRHRCRFTRTWGDCYGHALVATGRAEIMLDPILSPWDAAALLPITEEAGGSFTSWTGERTFRGGSGVSTNAALAAATRAILAGDE